ncbi:cytochrome P450 [Stachybotrys elegans]|uniref:Cytochrome P450 n=1 Tax=Stachybotrys elegans TaxID=80388 RepID=A0A8K0WPM6_9HYPO|nr:cytochrome P450 [Stachybotrys elegans]
MAITENLLVLSRLLASYWVPITITGLTLYATAKICYNLYLHPAAKFPGPRLAAATNLWWSYQWTTGRYPFIIAKTLEKYGDVVRVAPNELVFITPKAASDIYGSTVKGLEYFPKADFLSLGRKDQGLTWERDPVKHRHKAKLVQPAFGAKSLKAKETKMHKHIDAFVQVMANKGRRGEAVEFRRWADWLSMDIATDMGYSHQLHQVEQEKYSLIFSALWDTNFFGVLHIISKKFSLLGWLHLFAVPPSTLMSLAKTRNMNWAALVSRIESRAEVKHLDHFDAMLPGDAPDPSRDQVHAFETICGQLAIAGSEPISSSFLCMIALSLQHREFYDGLVAEVRGSFDRYEDITASSVAPLKLLHAALMEQLRIVVVGATGQPRVSPGAEVDGHYIAKGVEVQYANYAFTRDARFFHEAYCYRPKRWLPEDHALWDPAYANDCRSDFNPWSLGVRACPGMMLSRHELKLMVAKVLWSFDLEMVPGQKGIEFESDFRMYSLLEKPDVWIRFHPVARATE